MVAIIALTGCSNPFGITNEEWRALSSEQKAYYRKEFYYYKADRKMPTDGVYYGSRPSMKRPMAPQVPYYHYYNDQPNGYAPFQPRHVEQQRNPQPFNN